MSDQIQSGLAWLAAQLAASASQAIAVVRGAGTDEETSVASTGTLSHSAIPVETAGGLLIRVESDEWAVPASAWSTLTPAEPQPGDAIVATVAGVVKTYEVFPVDGEHCYRDLGGRGVLLSVHTKLRQS